VEERILIKREYSGGQAIENTSYISDEFVRVKDTSGTYDYTYVKHERQRVAEMDPNGNKKYIHPDHLGSTTIITDSSGDVIEKTSYTPYGVLLTGGRESRYGYEGKEHDKGLGEIPTNGLVAYWSLETDANDEVGDNDGTISGATSASGIVRDAYSFDGTDDYIEIDEELVDFNEYWSISFWATNLGQHQDAQGLLTNTNSGPFWTTRGVSFTKTSKDAPCLLGEEFDHHAMDSMS
jgi:hypothetical protein